MMGPLLVVASAVCSVVWLFMIFTGKQQSAVFSVRYEIWMLGSLGFAALAAVFLRIGF